MGTSTGRGGGRREPWGAETWGRSSRDDGRGPANASVDGVPAHLRARHGRGCIDVLQRRDLLGRRNPSPGAGGAVRHPGRGVVGRHLLHPGDSRDDADDRLAGHELRSRPGAVLEPRRLHVLDDHVRAHPLARRARRVAAGAGRHGRADPAARPVHPARRLPAPSAWAGDLHLRDDQHDWTRARPGSRRLSRRGLRLALGILHDRARGIRGLHRDALRAAGGRAAPQRLARLDRLPVVVDRHRRHSADAVARRAARLVRLDGDHHRDLRRGARLLHLPRPQRDRAGTPISIRGCCSTATTSSASV